MTWIRKRPVILQAVRWNGQSECLIAEFGSWPFGVTLDGTTLVIVTLDGERRCPVGNWLIRGETGEFDTYCHDLFERLYDVITEGGRMVKRRREAVW